MQVLVAVTDPIAQFELVDTLVAWQHDVRVAAVACDVRNCLSRGPQPRVVIVDAGMLPVVAGAPRLPRTRLLLLDEAAVAYSAILQAEPDRADAWHLLGLIAQEKNQEEKRRLFLGLLIEDKRF